MRFGVPHKETYHKEDDAFPTQYLLLPTLLLGMAVNQDHSSPFEMCWAFSIYLEAVAILPQLFMLQKQGGAESLTSHYVMLLGLYRLFYLFNWIYRYATEDNYMQIIVWVSGIVQTALYLDFFWNYVAAKRDRLDAPIALAQEDRHQVDAARGFPEGRVLCERRERLVDESVREGVGGPISKVLELRDAQKPHLGVRGKCQLGGRDVGHRAVEERVEPHHGDKEK